MTKRKVRKKSHKGLWITLILLIVLAAGAGGAYFWYSSLLKPVGGEEQKIGIEIDQGEGLNTLLHQLKEKGLIKSEEAAKIYGRLENPEMYAGTYELSPTMSVPEIFAYLANPANAVTDYIPVMIPEGTWAKDTAQILADEVPNLSKDEFMRLWNDDAYIEQLAAEYPFLDPSKLENDQYFVKLEGYLFPDTYYVGLDANEDQVTRMMLDRFNEVYAAHQAEIDNCGRSIQDLITLASVIQFESGDPSEMNDISGVFVNRLNQGMPLESSVTVCYALYDDFNSGEDCETNTQIDSPYNTYLHSGLPIGPILNPGEDAIMAALRPTGHDYLFFVSDVYGDGKTYFARTYDEHLANIDRFNLQISDSQ